MNSSFITSRPDFWIDYVCFFVWLYGLKQFKLFHFAFLTMDASDLLITGHNHILLSKHSLSLNNVMFTLTSTQTSTHFVEQTSVHAIYNKITSACLSDLGS